MCQSAQSFAASLTFANIARSPQITKIESQISRAYLSLSMSFEEGPAFPVTLAATIPSAPDSQAKALFDATDLSAGLQ